MNTSEGLFGLPFQWQIFLIASLLNILFGRLFLIKGSIMAVMHLAASEAVYHWKPKLSGTAPSEQKYPLTIHEEMKRQHEKKNNLVKEIKAELNQNHSIGMYVGIVEREIYFYCLLSGLTGLLGSVLLFKAFSGWLKLSESQKEEEEKSAQSNETQRTEDQSELREDEKFDVKTLARYYGYAIGNFLSLLWALLIYEIARHSFAYSATLRSLLNFSQYIGG